MGYGNKLLGVIVATTLWLPAVGVVLDRAIAQEKRPSILTKTSEGRHQREAEYLLDQGFQYLRTSHFQNAIQVFSDALAIYQASGNRWGEAEALYGLGWAYDDLGQIGRAIDLYEQSLAIAYEIDNSFQKVNALNLLGYAHLQLGQYSQAIHFNQKVLEILSESRINYPFMESLAFADIALAHSFLDNLETSLSFSEQALEIAETHDLDQLKAWIFNDIGRVHQALGQYEQALGFHDKAIQISQEIENPMWETVARNDLGVAYQKLGDYQQAMITYQQALSIASQIQFSSGEAQSLRNIGYLLSQQDQPELAITFYKQSVQVREFIRQGIQNLRRDLRESYVGVIADDYRYLADLLLQQGRVLEAQEVLDLLKLQELEDFQLRDVKGTPTTQQGLSFWQAEREILERYDQFLTQPESDINSFIAQSDISDRITQLRRDARGQNLNPEQLGRLQRNLQQAGNAALLYPLILDDRLELVLVTTTRLTRHTVAVDRPTLEAAIANFRHAITDRRSNPQAQAQELYQWLMAPLVADLEAADATTILYAADGQLRYIPLAALHDGEQWLTQRYTINHITAASLMDFSQAEQAEISILAGAFPAQGMEVNLGQQRVWFDGLPFAQVEVQNLMNLLPQTTAFFSEAFSRDALEPQLNTHRILHLATHAEFKSGHPIDSYILLGDGDRITLFDLDQWDLPNVDLVVLSACRTGVSGEELGTGEEILGFGYQVQRTGARGAIASLWYVNDGGTQVLMDTFYAALNNGYSKAKALQRAQIALITSDQTVLEGERGATAEIIDTRTGQPLSQSDDLAHPYYWAPFILIGNGL